MKRYSLGAFLLMAAFLVSCSFSSRLEGSWTSSLVDDFSTLIITGDRFSLTYHVDRKSETAEGRYSIKESSFADGKSSMRIVFVVLSSTKTQPDNSTDFRFLATGENTLICTLTNTNTNFIIAPNDGKKGLALCGSYEK